MKKNRVLQVLAEPFENGGQELFITNLYKNIDKESIQFDFIAPYGGNNEKLRKEVEDFRCEFLSCRDKTKKRRTNSKTFFF